MSAKEPLLRVEELCMYFSSKNHVIRAAQKVSFEINEGETYGLVGESGSGKSTIGRCVIRLYEPTSGKIYLKGTDISGALDKEKKELLYKNIQMIFQDPMSSLNPRKTAEEIVGEGLDIHHLYDSREERKEKILRILSMVGLSPEQAGRYPAQFSGGQRQRIGIARALVMEPSLIIADECIAALDVSIDTLLGHAAPSEHARLVAYARACGLEVSEAEGMVIVRLTADGLEGLTPSTMEVLQGLDIQPVTVRDFDSIVTHTQALMEERTREQALFEIAYALNSTLQTIKKLPAE